MRTSENTFPVALFQCSQPHAWYSEIPKPEVLIVTESGVPDEWFIAYGKYAGCHVSKEDCTGNLGEIEPDVAV